MAVITDDHRAEQDAILPKVRPLRFLRWIAAVLALGAAATCLLLLVRNDIQNGALLTAAAVALVANAGLALAALVPVARDAQARLLSEMMGQSREGQMVTGRDGRVLYINKAAADFFDTAGPDADIDRLSGGDGAVARTLQRLQSDALSGVSGQDEARLTLADGEIHGLELRVHPIGNPADKVAWYLAEATARQELREVLRNEQALLTDFLDNAPVGFFSVDQAGQFVLSNNTLADWLGYRPDELAGGQDLRSVVVGDSATLLPGPNLAVGEVPDEGGGDGHSTRNLDVTFQARGGATFQAHITQSVVGDAIKGEARTRSVVRNLSLERERRSALQTAERRFREFFDHAPVAVLLLDADGVIQEANATFAALLRDGETAVERPLFDFVSADDRDEVARRLQAAWSDEPSSGPLDIALFAGPQQRQMELYASGRANRYFW